LNQLLHLYNPQFNHQKVFGTRVIRNKHIVVCQPLLAVSKSATSGNFRNQQSKTIETFIKSPIGEYFLYEGKTVKWFDKKTRIEEGSMENGVNDLEKMNCHQLSYLRQTLEKARDDKLVELKHIEAELKATIERLKRVQTAYYVTLQKEEARSRKP
jgi:DNA replication protein DnaD